jgi:hypothetical protein
MAMFQLWDGVITQVFADSGIIKEGNPLMAGMVSSGGFLPFKIIGVIAAALALWLVYKYFPKVSMITASTITIFYIAVIVWNFAVVFNTVLTES